MTDFSHDNIADPSLPRACRNVVGTRNPHENNVLAPGNVRV